MALGTSGPANAVPALQGGPQAPAEEGHRSCGGDSASCKAFQYPCCPLAAGPGAARMPQPPRRCLSLSSLITVSVKTAVLSTIMYR